MTDNVKRRISKWDVLKEPDVCLETKLKSDWKHSSDVGEQIPQKLDLKAEGYMESTISYADNMPIGSSQLEDEKTRRPKNVSGSIQSPGQPWRVDDGLHNYCWESRAARSHTTLNDAKFNLEADENNGNYGSGMSPGHHTWRKHGQNLSSRGGWSSPIRKQNNSRSRSRSRSRNIYRRGSRSRSRSRSIGRYRRGSKSRSRSRSIGQYRRGTKSRSRSRNRRSRSWSRSRSPIGRRGPETSSDRRRVGAEQGLPCRDFAAGRCRRGKQCKFLHDGGRMESDRIYKNKLRERRFERDRFSGRDGNENFRSARDDADYLQNKTTQRYLSNCADGDWEKSDLAKILKPAERCYDFIKGRCHRGASCRYIHHEASSQSEWSVKDEANNGMYEGKELDSSFGRRFEPQRMNAPLCKFFAEGRCRRGQGCKFLHQGMPDHLEVRTHDDPWDYDQATNANLPTKVSNFYTQELEVDGKISSLWTNSDYGVATETLQPQHLQPRRIEENDCQNIKQEASQDISTSQLQSATQETHAQNQNNGDMFPLENGSSIIDIAGADLSKKLTNLLTPITGENFVKSGQGPLMVPQVPHAPNFPHNNETLHTVLPLINGQVAPFAYSKPPNGQGQFAIPLHAKNFNVHLQGQPVLDPSHNGQNQQGFNFGGQVQQKSHLSNNAQFIPLPVNGQVQKIMNLSGQNPHNVPPLTGQNPQNVAPLTRQNPQNVLPLTVQDQMSISVGNPNHQSLLLHQMSPGPLLNIKHFGSGDHQQHTSGKGSNQAADTLEAKPPTLIADSAISSKVITSEQAARITNLSASLAQFFGNAVATGLSPSQPFANTGSVVPTPAIASGQTHQEFGTREQHSSMPDNRLPVKSETNNLSSSLSLVSQPKAEEYRANAISKYTNDDKHEKCDTKEENKTEPTDQQKKERRVDADADDIIEGERKKIKDTKGTRMFKCSLVEFVKGILKPIWKEGQLSKESHKIIVKKVVEKVTGTLQGPNIPQTREKIDLYLAHTETKLTKLVQAYVEKYGKA